MDNSEIQTRSKKEVLFEVMPLFKDWIKQTKLFNVLKETNGRNIIIEGFTEDMRMSFQRNSNIKIIEPEDLPEEVIKEFFINSPFYTLMNLEKIQFRLTQ